MKFLEPMIVAFSMYSKIPMPRIEWNKENMKYTMCFFPLIGVVTGVLIYLAGMFLDGNIFPKVNSGRLMFAAVMTLIPVFVSGGIHLDGLLDTADALSSYKTKEEKLEILKDSHAGAFAIIIGICWFVLDFGIYSEADAHTIGLLAIGFVISRTLSGLSLVSFRMAKNTGLAATFSDMALKSRVRIVMICYLIVCAGLLLYLDPLYGTAELIGALLVFFWYRHLSYEKFGGITGDLAGFFLQNCELFMAVCVIGLRIVLR